MKTSWRHVLWTSWRQVFKTFWRHVFKTSWRHVLKTSWRRLQRNNFSSSKTSSRRLGRRKIVTLKTCWRRLQDMSWRRLQDVLKTSKCLLGNQQLFFPLAIHFSQNWIFLRKSDFFLWKISYETCYYRPVFFNKKFMTIKAGS